MLTDWTDEHPERVFAKLKKQSDYYNFRQRTLTTFLRDVRKHGLGATLAERRMWGQMRMSAADLADVTGYTYTYLMNGQRARRQLDRAVHAGREGPAPLHQRVRRCPTSTCGFPG